MSDTTQPTSNPETDPRGYIRDVLARNVRAGFPESLIRTWVPALIGSVLAWIGAHFNIVVPDGASSTVVVVATGVAIGGYYLLARGIERKWPRLGRWLVALGLVKATPVYTDPAVAKTVTDGTTPGMR